MKELICKFCGKQCKTGCGFTIHERSCKLNPNRVSQPNHWTTYPNWKVSDETRKKFKNASTGRKHSEKTKKLISDKRKNFLLENPDKVPYVLNHYSKGNSFPENYFEELFEKEKIALTRKHRIYLYELDFCDLEKKVDIEIDGEQHYLDSRILKSDKRRTNYLESLGWKVFRIRWSEYQKKTYEEKKKVIYKIRQLLVLPL